jgi:hypothetical protein
MSKGAIGLVAETLVAAERSGLRVPILRLLSLEFGRTGSAEMVLRMLESTARNGDRRLEEMSAVRSSLEEVGVVPVMVDATMKWISMLSRVEDARGTRSIDEVLAVLARELPRASE